MNDPETKLNILLAFVNDYMQNRTPEASAPDWWFKGKPREGLMLVSDHVTEDVAERYAAMGAPTWSIYPNPTNRCLYARCEKHLAFFIFVLSVRILNMEARP